MENVSRSQFRLCIVIVNYYTVDWVDELLTQISQQRLAQTVDLTVVCSDNSVCDKEYARLEQLQSKSQLNVMLVKQVSNLGFGAAINASIKGRHFDLLCCLNPDVTLLPDTLGELIRVSQEAWSNGIWGGLTVDKQNYPDGRHAWREPTLINTLAWALGVRGLLKLDALQDNYANLHRSMSRVTTAPYSVDSVSGCCFCISSQAWFALRGFDEDFFLYSEEIDLCRRARQMGFQPTVVPTAKLRHLAHPAEQRVQRLGLIYRSKLLYASKHHGLVRNIVYRLTLLLGAALRALKALISGRFGLAHSWYRVGLIASAVKRSSL